jgi:alcohol dehydrogenase (cytochrome c)
MRIKRRAFAIPVALSLIGTACAAALIWKTDYWKSTMGLESVSNEKIWNAVTCRANLYLQKAKGAAPEVSWPELWTLTSPGFGFNCIEGSSLEANLHYSTYATQDDRMAGVRIFNKQCTGCHGSDGSGGPHAPSLLRSEYDHGDSDLAIYKVLRDGVPGTAMPSAHLSLRERLQVVAQIRSMQDNSPKDQKTGSPLLAIQASSERLKAAGTKPDEWLTYSGSYDGSRYSSLAEITPANVTQLRARWVKQFDSNDDLSTEATPLVIDGVMFLVAPASRVTALDVKTGDVIWKYERPVPSGLPLCCGQVNRGLAVHDGTLFVGSLDGYLIAINANDGKALWQTSVANPSDGYSITGAPLVVNDSVVVGVAAGEFGARGFLAAYDVSTGQQKWRFETIPGPGEFGHETWQNDAWRMGGGPTWNTGSYDPVTDLLYWGVGNPSPNFAGDLRPGDNLFTDSVIALHTSTGKLAWYFQFTPHDEHDWDSSQTPVLTDLVINGLVRKVICWANRNGFYYVLDRVTGEFLIGVPFVELNWAKGLTSAGRPIVSNVAKISMDGRSTRPGIGGGTNWQNPAFDQRRGSIFVPTTESSSVFTKLPPERVTGGRGKLFVGSGWSQLTPSTRTVRALDAATGRRKWEYTSPPGGEYSGLLATEGGLVFGASGGVCFALDADTGREVWRLSLGGATRSAPISFTVAGRQVIVVTAGRAVFMFGL